MDRTMRGVKGVEALEECIKMWRLNRTSPAQRRKRGRIQEPPGGFCSMDDETWDHVISTRGCGATICGYGQQRAYVQFMPKGTKWLYMREKELIAAKDSLPNDMTNVAKSRVAEFRRTKRGRAIYGNAPKGAKLFYQRGLNGIEYGEKPVYDHYRMMDDASWNYIIAHAETVPLKADLADIRKHMQGQPEGTNMFWWRGRHRPMNADSFDEAKMREIAAELALAKMGYDDGRMWYTNECRDMTLEAMRLSGLKALYLDLPKEGYGSANFFFRGPFWDLHYWDPTSQKRFVDVVHKMWTGK